MGIAASVLAGGTECDCCCCSCCCCSDQSRFWKCLVWCCGDDDNLPYSTVAERTDNSVGDNGTSAPATNVVPPTKEAPADV